MAQLEIPSIVVHNGSSSSPGSPAMERASRTLRKHMSLTKQLSQLDDEFDEGVGGDNGEHLPASPPDSEYNSSPAMALLAGVVPDTPNNHHHNGPPHGPGPGGGGGDGVAEGPCTRENGSAGHNQQGGGVSSHGGSDHLNSDPSRSKMVDQRSTDSDAPLVTSARHRHHGGKLKLLQRSLAMREDTSPPPEILEPGPIQHSNSQGSGGNTLTITSGGANRRRLKHQGSSQGSFEGSSPCLSRDSSMEYTDSSGVDLQLFIIQTLHKNQKDRMMMLKIEHELVGLVKDTKRSHHKFPPMSSYQRMLVHRCAAFFGLEHNVDQAGTAVIVNKTRSTRLPETKFRDHCRDDLLVPDEPKRSILKRDSNSFDDGFMCKSLDRQYSSESRRSKSFEEREEEYEKVRKRIFSQESLSSAEGMGDSPVRSHDSRRSSQDDSRWHDSRHWSFLESELSHRKHHYDNHRLRPGRLPKVESFESRETLHPRSLRPPVFKSHSFGGYSAGVTVLSRGESVASNLSSSKLSKQDSTSSRLSEHSSSSGYKTQRQDTSSTNVSNTLSTTPSPTTSQQQQTTGHQIGGVWSSDGDGTHAAVMWAVTDMEAVPPGAMLINPQSGQPYINSDGSVYRFDPSNPPHIGSGMSSTVAECSSSREKDTSDKEPADCHSGSIGGSTTAPVSPVPPHDHPPPATICSPSAKQRSLTQTSPESPQNAAPAGVTQPSEEPKEAEVSCEVAKETSVESVYQPQGNYAQYYQQLDTRPFVQEVAVNEVSNNLRGLCLSGSTNVNNNDIMTVQVSGAPIHPNFLVHRHQINQYQMAPVQAGQVQATAGVQSSAMQHVQALPTLQAVPGVAGLSSTQGVPPAANHPHIDPNPIMPAGAYTVVTYPTGGNLGPNPGGHEAGGTTYYYQLSAPAGVGGTIPAAQAPTTLQQYNFTPTSTNTFPPMGNSLGYYTAGGVAGGGVYQTVGGMQGIYGTPQAPPVPSHGAAVSYRAHTPPHTPNTQAMSLGLGYMSGNSGVGQGGGMGGQYMAVVPPQQPPTPTSHAPPQLFTTFFRPSMQCQMMGGSAGTPPPQPMLQYTGGGGNPAGTTGAVTPHPPVFAKPYGGPAIHTIMPGSMADQTTVMKDDKLLATMSQNIAAASNAQASHLLTRPYPIMQSEMRIFGGPNGLHNTSGLSAGGLPGGTTSAHLRAPPLMLRPRHPNAFTTTPVAPLSLARPPKVRRQRSRTSYIRSHEVIPHQLPVERQDNND